MTPWRLAVASIGAFTAPAISVHLGLLNALDATMGESARPHNILVGQTTRIP